MLTLKGDRVYLRALEPDDLDFLFTVENDEQFWEVSATSAPFSRYLLKQYLQNSHKDIYEVKQLRLVISEYGETAPLGFIDIFDFDPKNQRAALGILIHSKSNQQKGFGTESLELLCKYCFIHLGLHQVYANIAADNSSSRLLFEKAGFQCTARKKDWLKLNDGFKDELTYQLINNVH